VILKILMQLRRLVHEDYHAEAMWDTMDSDSVDTAVIQGSSMEWLSAADDESSIRSLVHDLSRGAHPREAAISWLRTEIVLKGDSSEYGTFVDRLSDEVTALICGGSRYRMARAELRKLSQYSRTAVLAIVSSAVGSHVGPYGYVVPPLVAILLGLISQVGLNAWCAGRR